MRDNWLSEQLEVFDGGVSSAVDPRLIKGNQAAWAMNMVFRGGNPHTRPALKYCTTLPTGLYQGGSSFSPQGGMLVVSIGGKLHKVRIGGNTFTTEAITLGYDNSDKLRQAWFCETVESLVIQDGQSYPIIYDGSTARRSDVTGIDNYNKFYDADKTDEENYSYLIPEVPIGRQMAYGNGRLWVAQGKYNAVAGDIRTGDAESELKFSENTYLSGGGALYFPKGINGLAFLPTVGGGETGSLLIFGDGFTESVRADITSRSMWQQVPAFVSPVFRSTGAAGQGTIVEVNQDLYWRDNQGGIRSIRSAASDERSAGNAPISREVSRVTDFESDKYIEYSSAIFSDNRYLCLANPFLLDNGGVGFKSIVALDFANISTMAGKTTPAYDGIWTGLNFVQLISATIDGKRRSFAVSYDADGNNRLWEIVNEISDRSTLLDVATSSPITQYVEYGRKMFGDPRTRKRLERFDTYLADVDGPVTVTAYWRTDNDAKWREWSSQSVCAKTTDASEVVPHVFKLLNKQHRPQLKTFTIPTEWNTTTGYQAHVGFEFQFRLKITGNARVYRAIAHASTLLESPYAGDVAATCTEEDTAENSIEYALNASTPGVFSVAVGGTTAVSGSEIDYGTLYAPVAKEYVVTHAHGVPIAFSDVFINGSSVYSVTDTSTPVTLSHGQSFSFSVSATENGGSNGDVLTIANNSAAGNFTLNLTSANAPIGAMSTWWDMDNQAGYSDGEAITTLTDFSGHSRTGITTSPTITYELAASPNGKPACRIAQVVETYAVLNENSPNGNDHPHKHCFFVMRAVPSTFTNGNGFFFTGFTTGLHGNASTANLAMSGINGGTFYLDGVDQTATGYAGLPAIHVYETQCPNGYTGSANDAFHFGITQNDTSKKMEFDLFEVLAFDSILSSGQRSEVLAYLKSKWGTP